MTHQRLYDLLIEADRTAPEMELDRIAFILEGFPNIDWLRTLIEEDAPRLELLMVPPAEPLSPDAALMRAADSIPRDGFEGRLAHLIYHNRGLLQSGDVQSITRAQKVAIISAADPETDSIEQQLRDTIVACDAVDTDFHVSCVAEMLRRLHADVLDVASLVEDAPRVAAELAKRALPAAFVERYGNRTSADDLGLSLYALGTYMQLYQGIVHDIARLLKTLFEQYGVSANTGHAGLQHLMKSGIWPNKISVERRPKQKYMCVYIWMIEDHFSKCGGKVVLASEVAHGAKVWDKDIVEKVVSPCIKNSGEALLKFIVCVAHNREEAKQLVERHNDEWRSVPRGHYAEQMDARDARHVILVGNEERPRSVFVWGGYNNYLPPDYWRISALPSGML